MGFKNFGFLSDRFFNKVIGVVIPLKGVKAGHQIKLILLVLGNVYRVHIKGKKSSDAFHVDVSVIGGLFISYFLFDKM